MSLISGSYCLVSGEGITGDCKGDIVEKREACERRAGTDEDTGVLRREVLPAAGPTTRERAERGEDVSVSRLSAKPDNMVEQLRKKRREEKSKSQTGRLNG